MGEKISKDYEDHRNIVKVDGNGHMYVLRKDLEKLNISKEEKNHLMLALKINKVKIVQKPRNATRVADFDFGVVASYGLESLEGSRMADIEYNDNGDLVYEDFETLDNYILKEFIPNNVKDKVNFSKNKKDLDLKKPYKSIQLSKIVKLGLSDAELKHVLELLEEKSIHVGGKASGLDGETEIYDYTNTYDIVKNYTDRYLNKKIDWEEMKPKFLEYYKTKDPALREELILKNLKLVPYCTWPMVNIYNYDREELDSYGYESLIKCVDTYDPYRGATFSTYATVCIRRFVQRSVGQEQKINADLFTKFNALRRIAEEDYGCKLEESPEMMEYILSVLESQWLIRPGHRHYYRSILQPKLSYEQMAENHDIADFDSEKEMISRTERGEFNSMLANAINKRLTPREAEVIYQRYGLLDGDYKSLKEVGDSLGLSKERVRQVESHAFRKLRWPSYNNPDLPFYKEKSFYAKRIEPLNTDVKYIPKDNKKR